MSRHRSRSYGSARASTTCSKCGEEVEFGYWWDRSVAAAGYEDTEHEAPDGTKCDLSESDCESTVDSRSDYDDDPYGGDGPDD